MRYLILDLFAYFKSDDDYIIIYPLENVLLLIRLLSFPRSKCFMSATSRLGSRQKFAWDKVIETLRLETCLLFGERLKFR